MTRKYIFGVAILVIAFYAVVIFSGLGINIAQIHWNFDNTAKFGDSFGPLSAFMAAIAAVCAYAAYGAQNEDLQFARSQGKLDRISNEKRDFEQTFFNLLRLFREISSEVDIPDQYGRDVVKGRDAFRRIIGMYIESEFKSDDHRKSYTQAYDKFRDDLAHYFRTYYHIVKFIDNANITDKKLYTRILRATVSESEIILIGLNCIHGGGRDKLKLLVEKYAMLHNVSVNAAMKWKLTTLLDKSAFGDRVIRKDGTLSG